MSAESKNKLDNLPRVTPIRENLFFHPADPSEEPKLIGCHCRECGNTFFPAEEMCPVCIKEGTTEMTLLSGQGRLVSFTRVMRAIPGFDSPYALGCIELDSGPSLIAQLEDWRDVDLKIGMRVQLVIGRIKQDKAGQTIIGPKFRPLSD